MSKFNTYSNAQLEWAINDCHATLEAGQYEFDHPYAKKLWAEIDAVREVQMARDAMSRRTSERIKAKQRRIAA